MVAVFIVLWIVAIVATGVVLISAVQLMISAARRKSSHDVWTFLLALVLILANIGSIGLLIKFTQEMLAER